MFIYVVLYRIWREYSLYLNISICILQIITILFVWYSRMSNVVYGKAEIFFKILVFVFKSNNTYINIIRSNINTYVIKYMEICHFLIPFFTLYNNLNNFWILKCGNFLKYNFFQNLCTYTKPYKTSTDKY